MESCARRLLEHGFWAYYWGETSRDMLLKRRVRLINLYTNADLLQISKLFPDVFFRQGCDEQAFLTRGETQIRFFVSDFPMDRAVHIPGLLDVERSAAAHAASRCLFSIHAIYYDCRRKVFCDHVNAYPDLKGGLIRTVQPPERAAEIYPSIALKTAKVLSETGFQIDSTLRSFLDSSPTLHDYETPDCSVVWDFLGILLSKWVYEALILLDELDILGQLLPELSLLKQVDQDKDHHPEGNGFWHTLECVKCVKKPNRTLMMAILLHDTGKAVTLAEREKHKPFPNHSSESGRIARGVLQRFGFPIKEIEEIEFLVRNHMILNAIDRLPEKRCRDLFISPFFPNLLELYRADLQSGYHSTERYYHAARVYREFLRRERMWKHGVYA